MKSVFYILFILLIGYSCKKYPDGPMLSLRTKKARITARWQMEKYLIDGADSTAKLNPHNSKYNICIEKPNQVLTDANINCFWELKDKERVIRFYHLPSWFGNFEFGLLLSADCEWKIMRLTHKQLWLQTTYQGRKYEAQMSYLNEK